MFNCCIPYRQCLDVQVCLCVCFPGPYVHLCAMVRFVHGELDNHGLHIAVVLLCFGKVFANEVPQGAMENCG